ncbi:hypothetical protein QYE76_013821 [Lolium multiflorum]|uniref:Uncharacterized protein n=1 Tax=Lolium multiflorum TaxID=4521 RepID=A0AAD8U4V6_LOLMU|nr:hypothetical protein QYE76_013821 [Lolium multiflorum]
MAEGTPITYEDLPEELKKKYDDVKALLEADLIGSFHRTRSHGIRWRGFSPGALDGVDLSTLEERTMSLRQEINFMRHPDLYQDKFKRAVVLVEADEDEGSAGDQELKLPDGLKLPTAQELNGKPYCKWHNTFSHNTNDCRVWRQQIQMAIEQGRLIFNQYAMKVDTHPFPAVNTVEYAYPEGCQPGFSLSINMVGPGHHSGKDKGEGSRPRSKDKEEAAPRDRLRHDSKRYITKGEVKSVRYQRPLSDHLLNKYVSQYDQRRRYNSDDERDRLASRNARRHRRHDRDEEGYERHAKEKSREQDDVDKHWDCPFFKHCWDSGMSRLPTIGNCPECRRKKKGATDVSVFKHLGPLPSRNKQTESSQEEDLEELEDDYEEEEDKYHRSRWCPDGLSRSQKGRVQRGVEEAERLYLHTLRKARPDLAEKIQRTLDEEGRPQRKEWRPKQRKADDETSAGTNMVFILPAEFCAPGSDEAPVAQLDLFVMMEADSSNRPILSSPCVLPVFSVDLTGDGKLGYGFTSADELEEVDIGPGDKPRPTFISKKLDPHLRSQMIALLKEYPDCFAWDYTEMPGLDRSIIEHRLPLKKGFRPFQQRARQMKAEILEEVKKEIEKMLAAGFIRPCRYAEWISSIVLWRRRTADGVWL